VSEGVRRDAIVAAWVLVLAMAGTLACDGSSGSSPTGIPERLILIMVDTLRRDHLSCYGSENPTPNIDALAERGQLYTSVKASFHQTSMSMGALFTGRTPSLEFDRPERTLFWNSATWCGLFRFAEKDGGETCIPPSVPTLAESVRDAGYWTIGITSNQFLYEPSGFSRGFEDWVEVGRKPADVGPLARLKLPDASKTRFFGHVNRAAIEAVDRRPNDRFFLYVHYMDVHDYGRRGPQRYARAVKSVDWAIGDLLGEFERRELLDDAVVIVTSDHGERLNERHAVRGKPGHTGNPSFQEVLEVPLIIAPPIARDASAFLRTEDLFFVIQEIVGVQSEASRDLAADELLITETDYRTYLRGRWKSALRRDDGTLHLFDLEGDPGETRDVAEAHPDVVEAHRRRIDELGEALSARRAVFERMSEDDRERLRALGYFEQIEDAR
jgi:arylsulfatase A-like enzyme